MFVALALTLAGALTPGWRQLEMHANDTASGFDPKHPEDAGDRLRRTVNAGLFSFLCTSPSDGKSNSSAQSAEEAKQYCEDWWKNQPVWEKAVAVLICITIIIELVALVYNFITFCCCCCRGHALKPLAPLALLGFILLGAAVVIYAVRNKDALEQNKNYNDPKNSIGYSFFLECGALALLLVNTVIGSASACLGDKCL